MADILARKCGRCQGCGSIANDDDGTPWTEWANLPPGSDLAVRMGVVRPIQCPKCDGRGAVSTEDEGPRTPHDMGFSEGEPLDFRTFQRTNLGRVGAFGHTLEAWSPMEWACAAAGEMGELCNALKKRARVKDPKRPGHDVTGKPTPTLADVGAEIADTIIYLDLLASRLGIDVNNAVRAKWNAVSAKMGHPVRL